jgi:hypothetical protein
MGPERKLYLYLSVELKKTKGNWPQICADNTDQQKDSGKSSFADLCYLRISVANSSSFPDLPC